MQSVQFMLRSNNTNKLSPQEPHFFLHRLLFRSNNTNKLSPQEPSSITILTCDSSNNTNKLSPQEPSCDGSENLTVQIIQINLVLKNDIFRLLLKADVQIIQINLVLKNDE